MMFARIAGFFLFFVAALRAQHLLNFPTDNRALLDGRPQDFFMHVNRNFEGEKSTPWQGGQYGFVRGPVRDGDGIRYSQLHEGIDIRPVSRNIRGDPMDEVRAVASGSVVHVSHEARASNYGKYVVVEHRWDGCPYYTLYAHLASIWVQPGQPLQQGQPLGIMGFTGSGIDRERAHTHFEVCMMLSKNFDGWHTANFPQDPNQHGIYNGLNLVGIDPAALLLAAPKDPAFKISAYIARAEPAFKITVKNSPNLYLVRAYPWLVAKGEIANPPSWTITFSRYGVPLRVEAAETLVTEPIVAWVKETNQPYARVSKNIVSGNRGSPHLSASGLRFAKLLTWPD
jgi:murein DD-endopeptidase MepM/ murein hydrolase activator NlpD